MRSLYGTFVVVTLVVMLVSGLFAFLLSNVYYQHALKQQNNDKYIETAEEIARELTSQTEVDIDAYLAFVARIGYQLHLVREDGDASFYGEDFRDVNLGEDTIAHVLAGNVYHGMAEFPKRTFVTGFFANELKNSVGVPFTYEGAKYALFLRPDLPFHFNEMRHLFAWLIGLTVLFSLVFELILAKYVIRPVSQLSEATKKVQQGDFTLQLDVNRRDEIGELAESFQQMSSQLAKLENMRNEFISNISHDIRSPLSNINGYMELLAKDNVSSSDKRTYIAIVREECERLSNLTTQLLLLSSLNQMTDMSVKTFVDVSAQIKSLVKKYQWKLFEREITVQYELADDLDYEGKEPLLLSVWDNLFSNAVKYNRHGGSIFITLEKKAGALEVSFRDTGVGLSEEQVTRIFERFYRGDASRTKEVEGSGLGLAIAEKIVSLHGGEILVESEIGIGTTFIVRLPLQ
ncbi:HAMP domain-containing sensor histidine kinase [Bacillus sp. FSL W7-1360]